MTVYGLEKADASKKWIFYTWILKIPIRLTFCHELGGLAFLHVRTICVFQTLFITLTEPSLIPQEKLPVFVLPISSRFMFSANAFVLWVEGGN